MTNLIISEDPEDLIVLLTDHGGFVGLMPLRKVELNKKILL